MPPASRKVRIASAKPALRREFVRDRQHCQKLALAFDRQARISRARLTADCDYSQLREDIIQARYVIGRQLSNGLAKPPV